MLLGSNGYCNFEVEKQETEDDGDDEPEEYDVLQAYVDDGNVDETDEDEEEDNVGVDVDVFEFNVSILVMLYGIQEGLFTVKWLVVQVVCEQTTRRHNTWIAIFRRNPIEFRI